MPKVNFPEGNVWKEFNLKTELITPPVIRLELKPSFKKDATLALLKEIKVKKEELEKLERKEDISDDFTSHALVPYFDSAVNLALTLVQNWDLNDDEDNAIPCDDEQKKFYLEPLMWESVVPEIEEETGELAEEIFDDLPEQETRKKLDYLFFKIISFCSNMKNFVKN